MAYTVATLITALTNLAANNARCMISYPPLTNGAQEIQSVASTWTAANGSANATGAIVLLYMAPPATADDK